MMPRVVTPLYPTRWRLRSCSGTSISRVASAWAAFVFGLLMDVHEGALFGQHVLAYTLLSYG